MAVKNPSLYHATEDLILSHPRKYYRAFIKTNHWQLRSLVGSPQDGIVFYPSGPEVIRLNTKTGERETITTLSFSPRCLTVSKDWVCCGGEHGNYTAVCLDERKRRIIGTSSATADTDPDARLPLDLGPSSRSIIRETISQSESLMATRIARGPLAAKTAKVGDEVVNCIELWSPNPTAAKGAHKVPLAIVSNNDFTVSIIDIVESDVVEELILPDCVNRSVMSPSGILLATICDDPFLYIHERVERPSPRGKIGTTYEWVQRRRMKLPGQIERDVNTMRGSFAAAFSHSGKYLAVATQYGIISIFEAATITDEDTDSLLKVFTSSRPGAEPGAVRDMAFSPGPFDLLAWTESSGRFCVADMRNLCLSRQLIKIDFSAEGVEKVTVTERVADNAIDPRLRNFRADLSTTSSTPDYLGAELDRRQGVELEGRRQLRQHIAREMLNRRQAPLVPEDLDVLHAHGIARRQRDAANAAREAEDSSTSRSPSSPIVIGSSLARTAERFLSRPAERAASTSNLPQALRDFINPERSTTSIRSYINERNNDRDRRAQADLEAPRRLHLIQLAAAESATENAGPESEGLSSVERLTLARQRLSELGNESPYNPWEDFEPTYHSRPPSNPPIDRSTPVRVEIEEGDRSDFANRLRRPWIPPPGPDSSTPSREDVMISRAMSRSGAAETMGLTWCEDGRVLYVGAEDGIHEYHVNVPGRKIFPSLVLR